MSQLDNDLDLNTCTRISVNKLIEILCARMTFDLSWYVVSRKLITELSIFSCGLCRACPQFYSIKDFSLFLVDGWKKKGATGYSTHFSSVNGFFFYSSHPFCFYESITLLHSTLNSVHHQWSHKTWKKTTRGTKHVASASIM